MVYVTNLDNSFITVVPNNIIDITRSIYQETGIQERVNLFQACSHKFIESDTEIVPNFIVYYVIANSKFSDVIKNKLKMFELSNKLNDEKCLVM